MAYTAKQIAKIIGVSQATLSLVINNKPGISDRTREMVIQELRDRGFEYLLTEPLETGSSAIKSNNIGFVVYRMGKKLLEYDSFFPLIMDGIERSAKENGYSISFITIDKDEIQEGIRRICDAKCCGIVIFATEMKEEDLKPFIESKLPFVLLDNHFNNYNINTVEVGNEQGTYRAVRYLYECGHRKIGYLRSDVDINSFLDRRKYALQAMHEMGIKDPERYFFETGYPTELAYEGMKKVLQEKRELPTAFLVDNDLVAVGAMKACKEAGLRVPEDISFIGFDDRPICFLSEPQLTTVAIPRDDFGAEAVRLLLRGINGDPIHIRCSICGKLVLRASVAVLN